MVCLFLSPFMFIRSDERALKAIYEAHIETVDVIEHALVAFEDRTERTIKLKLRKMGYQMSDDRSWSEQVGKTSICP